MIVLVIDASLNEVSAQKGYKSNHYEGSSGTDILYDEKALLIHTTFSLE